ncbi:MAG: uracil-DNA glycosylase [Candidatus Cloacimonetes bacterium]|nr:uracil-DNA glycosylase [Candidatus Cloacimonadota bacterium]
MCKWYQVCPLKYYSENKMLDRIWIREFCFGNWANCLRYQQEEAGISHPDDMLPDGTYLVSGKK